MALLRLRKTVSKQKDSIILEFDDIWRELLINVSCPETITFLKSIEKGGRKHTLSFFLNLCDVNYSFKGVKEEVLMGICREMKEILIVLKKFDVAIKKAKKNDEMRSSIAKKSKGSVKVIKSVNELKIDQVPDKSTKFDPSKENAKGNLVEGKADDEATQPLPSPTLTTPTVTPDVTATIRTGTKSIPNKKESIENDEETREEMHFQTKEKPKSSTKMSFDDIFKTAIQIQPKKNVTQEAVEQSKIPASDDLESDRDIKDRDSKLSNNIILNSIKEILATSLASYATKQDLKEEFKSMADQNLHLFLRGKIPLLEDVEIDGIPPVTPQQTADFMIKHPIITHMLDVLFLQSPSFWKYDEDKQATLAWKILGWGHHVHPNCDWVKISISALKGWFSTTRKNWSSIKIRTAVANWKTTHPEGDWTKDLESLVKYLGVPNVRFSEEFKSWCITKGKESIDRKGLPEPKKRGKRRSESPKTKRKKDM